ncbi:DUF6357 family protein [Agrococcus sp. ARC_14]|uniref:DUF6357 family protein n=1 Tax=Agrococcus sp. ARC_14 TaxID=2919927 RepID=UPI001F064931|nr:DUF6357 family protein [Agrococcus sp. ARC_14]MCH1882524.1 DUF6357 family protein [Agrococcus sp. ARC_14]
MREVVFALQGWLPRVVRDDGGDLLLEVAGGADALHDPRTFTFPVREHDVAAMRGSLPRHVLLHAALLPLCEAAGIRDPIDAHAAATLLERILLGSQGEVDTLFERTRWNALHLIAHGANVELLEQGRFLASAQSAHAASHWGLARAYDAQRDRAEPLMGTPRWLAR